VAPGLLQRNVPSEEASLKQSTSGETLLCQTEQGHPLRDDEVPRLRLLVKCEWSPELSGDESACYDNNHADENHSHKDRGKAIDTQT